MRCLEDRSGRWTGFWIQGRVRGHMGLTLRFAGGQISGEGIDSIGGFYMSGTYNADGQVKLTKSYRWHAVRYSGTWDGVMIYGIWTIVPYDRGEFEIWPEKADEGSETEVVEEVAARPLERV